MGITTMYLPEIFYTIDLLTVLDIDRPLQVYGGKKFHMRVHVVASGTLQVYVHQDIIALISSESYVREEIDNRFMRINESLHVLYN